MSNTTLRIRPQDLARELGARGTQTRKATRAGVRLAAERGRGILAQATPVDTGAMKARWRVSKGGTVTIVNDAPYAGVVEAGARPHGVSIEGRHAIKLWFMRKVGLPEKEAAIRTEAFCQRLMAHGWVGKFFVRNSLDQLNAEVAKTIEHVLAEAGRKMAAGAGNP